MRTIELILRPDGSYGLPEVVPDERALQLQQQVQLQQGVLGGITSFEVADIPLGAGLVGGGIALLADTLLARFLPGLTGSMANLAAAWAVQQWGSRWVGKEAARFAAGFLAYEAFRGTVENLVANVTKGITGAGGGGGGTQQAQLTMGQESQDGDLETWLARA